MNRAVGRGPTRGLVSAGLCLGLALGGFFDGILLHQILQWHHLLSGVAPGDTAADLRLQVLADGLFHLAAYAVALVGLSLLWRARAAVAAPGSGSRLLGWALVGFGGWHLLDGALSHWALGLHRIRMDAEAPLLWDLLWAAVFGALPLAAGARELRRPPAAGPPSGGGLAAVGLALAALIAGPLAMAPAPGGDDATLAVFRPGLGLPEVAAAADFAGGRAVWSDARGGVWLIALDPGARPARLYRRGALLVSRGPIAAGCLSWTRF